MKAFLAKCGWFALWIWFVVGLLFVAVQVMLITNTLGDPPKPIALEVALGIASFAWLAMAFPPLAKRVFGASFILKHSLRRWLFGSLFVIPLAAMVLSILVVNAFASFEAGTPEGKARAAREEAETVVQARADANRAQLEANMAMARDQQAEAEATRTAHVRGIEKCLGFSGSNRSLVKQVKEQLQDRSSFEHRSTTILSDGVVMEYAARNGFNALRVGTVTATIDPQTCEASGIAFSQ